MAQILQPTPKNLDLLAGHLSRGDLVAIPTETVYGLAGNALDPEAVAKIYAAKGRPSRNPLIVHIRNQDQLDEIADASETARHLISWLWPGPLTVILPKKLVVPDSVTAGLNTVAVRMPSHRVFKDLASRCTFPLAAPSANPFGYVSPTRAEHVQAHLGESIDWILDGGPCEAGIESTIVSLADPNQPILLRHGSISIAQLESILGRSVQEAIREPEDRDEGLRSPGLMKRHYSPHTPVRLFEGAPPQASQEEAVVFLDGKHRAGENHFGLSSSGDLEEVARNLYDCLQNLDHEGFQKIYLEQPDTSGIGLAIRDRMKRAASQD
ncbi:MAG: L-threonylcarbamoyladenylate synthase [Verrucomicrobia bacterium]|nr:L-threonylcarbamoyladenylate synthase [Verrucomicrobiota bacterium]